MSTTSTGPFPAETDPTHRDAYQPPVQPPVHDPVHDPVQDPGAGPRKNLRTKIAAGVLALGLVGGGAWVLTHHGGTASATASTAQAGAGLQGGPGSGTAGGAPSGMQAPVTGTVSAVSATSISVKTTNGTSTFTIASGAVVENNGTTTTADQLTVGEQVVVFTGAVPGSASSSSADSTSANRIMAGTSATQGPGSGTMPGVAAGGTGSAASGSAGSTGTTGATGTTRSSSTAVTA
jgi:hypothetical protein